MSTGEDMCWQPQAARGLAVVASVAIGKWGPRGSLGLWARFPRRVLRCLWLFASLTLLFAREAASCLRAPRRPGVCACTVLFLCTFPLSRSASERRRRGAGGGWLFFGRVSLSLFPYRCQLKPPFAISEVFGCDVVLLCLLQASVGCLFMFSRFFFC